jgi:hypothetical protein
LHVSNEDLFELLSVILPQELLGWFSVPY